MMLTRHKRFSGGYRFKNFEGSPEEKIIELNLPEKVIVPLTQGFGDESLPTVKVGDSVEAGQIIGLNNDSISSPVHASVNGAVEEIKKINYCGQEIQAVIITSNGTKEWKRLEGHTADWGKLPAEKIEGLVYLSGAASFGKQGIPTRFKSSIISPNDVEHIIVHGIGSEVYNLSLSVLLAGERLPGFIEGLKVLKKIMPDAEVHLALNKYQKELIEQISNLMSDCAWVHFYALEPKYPQAYEEALIPAILNKKFPYGYSAANMGVVVLDTQAVCQVYEAVIEGKPVIERTMALCGPGFKENPHLKVRVGTPLEYIIKDRIKEKEGLRFILNSALTGPVFSDFSLPIDRTGTAIISLIEEKGIQILPFMTPGFKKDSYSRTCLSFLFSKSCGTNLHGEKRPCLFCSFCDDVCPVDIVPHLLYRRVERDIIDESLLNLKIFKCIECNLCTYVCPSKIPLARYIKEGKERLIKEGLNPSLPDVNLRG